MRTRRCMLLLGAALLPWAAQAADQKLDDAIYDKVRLRLAGDPDVKGGALEVDVKDGAVTLKGVVRTEKAKAKAERLTKKIDGVKKVVNDLTVAPMPN